MGTFDWSNATVIETEEIQEFLYPVDNQEGEDGLRIEVYFTEIKPSGIAWEDLADFIRHNFVSYVFSQDTIEGYQEAGESAHADAVDQAGIGPDLKRDGTLGEFLLFLLADGFHDLPMISHKVSSSQSWEHEVFGCDNLYFGEFNGEECIGIGEAKVHKSLSSAVKDALNSLEDFHQSGSKKKWEQDVDIASNSLSGNLDKEELDFLADTLVTDYTAFPVLHPILICHDTAKLEGLESAEQTVQELKAGVKGELSSLSYLEVAQEKVEEAHHRIKRAFLVFFFLPVPDIDEFRKRMLTAISAPLGKLFEEYHGGED